MPLDYPIKFKPILQERIWGGEKLHTLFGKAKQQVPIGESWEISSIPNNVSVVANGSLKGKNLQYLIDTYKADFVGEKVFKRFGRKFPLLLKFLDAKSDLSIQLHPNDDLAQKRHQSFGKEEMWYVMQTEKESYLYFGFNKSISKDSYLKHLKDNSLAEVLHRKETKEGDVFHIPAGRVHAIGAGVVLAEIQQSSDITYRLYDWDRKNAQGKARELHTELAIDAIDFTIPESIETTYSSEKNKLSTIFSSDNFTTKILTLTKDLEINTAKNNSFAIYMCVSGSGDISTSNYSISIKTGETIYIPAKLQKYQIKPDNISLKLLQISL